MREEDQRAARPGAQEVMLDVVALLDRVTSRSFLVTGLLVVALVAIVPGWPGELLWGLVPVATVGAMVLGIRRNRPAAPRAWWLMTAGLVWGITAELGWTVWYVSVGDAALIPWWYDLLFLPTYGLLAVGFHALPRNSLRAPHPTATMDAVVVVVGYALLYWAVVYRDDGVGGIALSPQRAVSVASLVVGLSVHFLAARLWFRYGPHNGAYARLGCGIAAATLADVLYSVTLDGDAAPGSSVLDSPFLEVVNSAAWLVWFVCFGAAALHPHARGTDDAPPSAAFSFARGILFFFAVTVGPVTFLERVRSGPRVSVAWEDLAVPLVTMGVLSGILVTRLVAGSTVAQRRAVLLDQQATDLAAALREQRALQERLHHQATHDPLTGLGNRMHFAARLDDAGAATDRALLMLDLDGFKDVNDGHGHPAGDHLLQQVADRMRDVVDDEGATLARLGGDEFAVLLDEAPGSRAHDTAWDLVRALSEPFVVEDEVIGVTASVGVRVLGPQDTGEDVLRDVDLALYAAKAAGKNQVVVFTPALRTEHADRSRLLTELRHALPGEELVVHYQPVVDLRTRRVLSVEALVRWDGPRGRVMPDQFIPLAEETGLIVPLGEHVLRRATADARPWWDAHGVAVHVNVSARQVRRPEFVDVVRDALASTGLPGAALVLEITETALLATGKVESAVVTAHLAALRGLGVRVAIDDFGTGYSSLAYLQRLPVDIVKIDGAFTRFAARPGDESRRRRALATAIVELCATLDLVAVAEQIELETEARAVQSLGCPLGQGYLFGRPVPAAEIAPLLGRPADAVVRQRTRR
ncbi:diguanylate cyclase/phosphodiesterase [Cellulomonas flavigena DSM 20109]|uniref:Diguanylate cyclase/phosphodiesterase n=1 Tax=Cellulomonas flavigena (strain ATCC 482 / DSM 20109 / BCRC 11376 / JCM 18109 / NBRC 3775 / NCIMB 8073 / NRS 134) TaxID=446466 RepID=D5ULJ3_CELFN|nr:EAL domain-containing protein [Cellulomonas flavigena]ADG74035.1 diguanylate cyclase/phosphodiesterase [Cellulomonas flavigena DSM 20109]